MNRVYELRQKLHMTQEEFAEYCNISRISVTRCETVKDPSRPVAEKIAKACNVSIAYVLGEASTESATNSTQTSPESPRTLTEADLADIARVMHSGTSIALTETEFALYGEAHDLTEAEKQDVLAYIRFRKSQRKPE